MTMEVLEAMKTTPGKAIAKAEARITSYMFKAITLEAIKENIKNVQSFRLSLIISLYVSLTQSLLSF